MISHEPDLQSQQRFSLRAALYAGAAVGAFLLIFTRGIPWGSWGVPEAIMGRAILAETMGRHLFLNAVLHMLVALVYAVILGLVIFQFDFKPALVIGVLVGLALYGFNYLIFNYVVAIPGSEFTVFFVHVIFCLVASAAYKALSVPRQRAISDGG